MSGYGLEKKFHLSTVLEKNLKEKGFDVNVINASVSGDTTSGGLNRLNWLIEKKYRYFRLMSWCKRYVKRNRSFFSETKFK